MYLIILELQSKFGSVFFLKHSGSNLNIPLEVLGGKLRLLPCSSVSPIFHEQRILAFPEVCHASILE